MKPLSQKRIERRGSGWNLTVLFATLVFLTGVMFALMRVVFTSFSF